MTANDQLHLSEHEERALAAAGADGLQRDTVLAGKRLAVLGETSDVAGDVVPTPSSGHIAALGADALARIRSEASLGLAQDDLPGWLPTFAALDVCAWLAAAHGESAPEALAVVEDAAADPVLARLIPFNEHRRAALGGVQEEFQGLLPWYAEWSDLPDDALERLIQAHGSGDVEDELRPLAEAVRHDAAHLAWIEAQRTAQARILETLRGSMGLRLLAVTRERLRLEPGQAEACAHAFSSGVGGPARQRDLLLFALAAPGLEPELRMRMLNEMEAGLDESTGGLPGMVQAWSQGGVSTSRLVDELEVALAERLALGANAPARADLNAVAHELLQRRGEVRAARPDSEGTLTRLARRMAELLGPRAALKSAAAFVALLVAFAVLYRPASEQLPPQAQQTTPGSPASQVSPSASISLGLRYYPAGELERGGLGKTKPYVTLGDGATLRSGDSFKITVTLREPAEVALFHMGRDGKPTLLTKERLAAGEHELPKGGKRLKLDRNPGVERFVLFTSSSELDVARIGKDFGETSPLDFAQAHPGVVVRTLEVQHER